MFTKIFILILLFNFASSDVGQSAQSNQVEHADDTPQNKQIPPDSYDEGVEDKYSYNQNVENTIPLVNIDSEVHPEHIRDAHEQILDTNINKVNPISESQSNIFDSENFVDKPIESPEINHFTNDAHSRSDQVIENENVLDESQYNNFENRELFDQVVTNEAFESIKENVIKRDNAEYIPDINHQLDDREKNNDPNINRDNIINPSQPLDTNEIPKELGQTFDAGTSQTSFSENYNGAQSPQDPETTEVYEFEQIESQTEPVVNDDGGSDHEPAPRTTTGGSQPVQLKIISRGRELGNVFMDESDLGDHSADDDDDEIGDETDHTGSDVAHDSTGNEGAGELDSAQADRRKLAKELYDKARYILRKRQNGIGTPTPAYASAYELMTQAAKLNYTEALEDVAYAYLFGRHFRQNVTKARVMFEELAVRGSPKAQMGLGFLHAVGLGVPSNQAKALVYYTFSALGGNSFAQMALGYRYKYGFSVEQSCESSLINYRRVARVVAQEVRDSKATDSPGVIQRIRLLDMAEPPQTPPPPSASSGPNSGDPSASASSSDTGSTSSTSAILDKDLIKYYKFLADKGDVQAQVGLGQLLYQGGRGVAPDPGEAGRLFAAAAEANNAYAQAYLGKMYLEGNEALPQNNMTASDYFKKSADQGNPMGQTGLGLIHLYGHGVQPDPQKAFAYFKMAADQGGPEALLHIANMYFTGTGVSVNYKQALKYYNLASQSGNLLAFFNLGQMHAVGLGTMRSCYTSMELFKNVAERGFWGRMLMEAYHAYKAEDVTSALVIYMFLAEAGYETAQSNAAYILEKESISWFPYNESLSRAFILWKRAAIQGYSMARIKLGDFHYYGHGTPVDFEAAAQNYRLAYEGQNNARAVFNLAFMHEKGFGLKKDLHLAKRYYDMAMESSPDAFVPVTLALAKLSFLLYAERLSKFNIKEIMAAIYDVDHYLPEDWDLYIILGFAFILGTLIYFRRGAPQQPPAPRP